MPLKLIVSGLPGWLKRPLVDLNGLLYIQDQILIGDWIKMLHAIARSLLPGDVVFDIGANTGNKAEPLVQHGLMVICVEPQPMMVQKLNARFQATENVVIKAVGIGSKRGKLSMSISSTEPTLSTFAQHWQEGRFSQSVWDASTEVEVIMLDDLVKEFGAPRYCKIDVEGYEREVIEGLSTRIGVISYEFTNEYMNHALEVLRKLIKLGYTKFNLSLGESEEFQFKQWIPYYELSAILHSARDQAGLWGDIYAN